VPSPNYINGATNTPPFTVISFPKPFEPAAWEGFGSTLLLTMGVGIFVSFFVLKPMEDRRQERDLKAIEELRKKIPQDVFAATMGKFVPDAIYEAVKNDVLDRGFVR
jgi:hypothetical protein